MAETETPGSDVSEARVKAAVVEIDSKIWGDQFWSILWSDYTTNCISNVHNYQPEYK